MPQEILIENMKLQTGSHIKVLGDIKPGANLFRINLGKDENTIGLHFNPRFRPYFQENVIVFNTLKHGRWEQEKWERNTYFVPGERVLICIIFDGKQFLVNLPNDNQVVFPNRLNLEEINFMSINGDFTIKKVDFE
ncbi:galectin-1-like [Sminthopsis crassicaudata]|uniref:galectin-1-like n=1 Tax=Sminthopsis crassicaudata TaxID=9301 RepID=UPI003D69E7CF